MALVREIMNNNVRTVSSKSTVFDAVKIMAEQDTGLLVVVKDESSRIPVGIISDTDVLKKVVVEKKNPDEVYVSEIMTSKIVSVSPDQTATDAVNLMKQHRYKRLPVIKEGHLEGIISNKELINVFIHYKKELLDLAIGF